MISTNPYEPPRSECGVRRPRIFTSFYIKFLLITLLNILAIAADIYFWVDWTDKRGPLPTPLAVFSSAAILFHFLLIPVSAYYFDGLERKYGKQSL